MTDPNPATEQRPTDSPPTRGRERRIVLEVLLVALGVVLGLVGEGWRQTREHHQLATETLQRIRAELLSNRAGVVVVQDRHAQDLRAIQLYLKAGAVERKKLAVPFTGTHPAFLQYAAWDVAVATQSIEYLDRDLATTIARAYAIQRQLDDATRDITQVMYAKAGERDPASALAPFAVYFGDCTVIEPRLRRELDRVITQIDRDLGPTGVRNVAGVPQR
jgi:hypothetical protein